MSGEHDPHPPNDKAGSGARGFLSGPKGFSETIKDLSDKKKSLHESATPQINTNPPADRKPQTITGRLKPLPKPRDSDDPLVGTVLGEKYAVIDLLGRGEMATVYRGRHLLENRLVAIKTMKCLDLEIMKRFAREVQAHFMLKHPNIVEAIEVIDIPGKQPYFVLEYLEGMSLAELLIVHGKIEREEEIGQILKQTCDALSHAHMHRVIHRDLKPGNIVLLEREGKIQAKVVDFGLAKIQDEIQMLTRAGQALGSPLYMSPEQCMGQPLTNRSDIYSLGVVAYEMVTGCPPFMGETVRDVMAAHCDPHIKPLPLGRYNPKLKGLHELNKVIETALQTEPLNRYESAEDFKNAIQGWLYSAGLVDSATATSDKYSSLTGLRKDELEETSEEEQKRSIYNVVTVRQVEKQKEAINILRSSQGITATIEKPAPTKESAVFKMVLLLVIGTILSVALAAVIILNMDTMSDVWKETSISLAKMFPSANSKKQAQPALNEPPADSTPKLKSKNKVDQAPDSTEEPDAENVRRLGQ